MDKVWVGVIFRVSVQFCLSMQLKGTGEIFPGKCFCAGGINPVAQ